MHSNCDLNSGNDNTEENDLFYFESEHLALRGNKDYSELLKTIAILEAQRAGAVKDIDKIIEMEKSALEDPVAFIEKIKNREDLGIPCPQRIVELPVINWSKYDVQLPEAYKLINEEKLKDKHKLKEQRKPKSDNISETFNKPWTSEEQKRLEELLVQFPPEAIEMRRYKKIADALGNRTVRQVTSRVQKYFLKLYKAGLPIPGRIPKISDKKKSYIHKHQRHNAYLYKPTTFFPDLEVPVYMAENDDEGTSSSLRARPMESNKGKSDLEIKINLLKKIKSEKEKDKVESRISHVGFKCDKCSEEPILGTRWHCYDCVHDSVDFCTDCLIVQIQNDNKDDSHPLRHNLQPIRNANAEKMSANVESDVESETDNSSSEEQDDSNSNMYDQDYMNSNNIYSYLDPNFLPE